MKKATPPNLPKRDCTVLIPDFFGKGHDLEAWQLGWQPEHRMETKSFVSKKIFNTYIEVCRYNMIFYYLGDGNYYGIHAEECPTPVFKFKKGPADYPIDQIDSQDTHDYAEGEVLYMVPCNESIWDIVKIDGKSLEEVLQNSYIDNIS